MTLVTIIHTQKNFKTAERLRLVLPTHFPQLHRLSITFDLVQLPGAGHRNTEEALSICLTNSDVVIVLIEAETTGSLLVTQDVQKYVDAKTEDIVTKVFFASTVPLSELRLKSSFAHLNDKQILDFSDWNELLVGHDYRKLVAEIFETSRVAKELREDLPSSDGDVLYRRRGTVSFGRSSAPDPSPTSASPAPERSVNKGSRIIGFRIFPLAVIITIVGLIVGAIIW